MINWLLLFAPLAVSLKHLAPEHFLFFVKVLDLIVGRVKERLARVRLEDLDVKGNG